MNTFHAILSAAALTGFFATATAAATTEGTTPATEKKWTHTANVGFTVPFAKYKVEGKRVGTIDYGLDINYIGIARNGFSVEVSVAGGASTTEDIKFEGSKDDIQVGRFTSFDFGLGYTFGAGKKTSLSVLGTVGYEIAYFESEKDTYKHEELGKVDRHFSETVGGLTLGGDVVFYRGFTDRAGMYASVGGRWIAKSASISTVTYEKGDDSRTDTHTNADYSGLYSIVPAVGVMFNF